MDRKAELPLDEIKCILKYFAGLGTKAVTITGGGEPSMHPDIEPMLYAARTEGIQIGLVTNGLIWGQRGTDLRFINETVTWMRWSVVNPQGPPRLDRLVNMLNQLPRVACSVSFTVTPDVDVPWAKSICALADSYENFTHIRFVQDILEPDNAVMQSLKAACMDITPKAIFQFRNEFTRGMTPCLISRLKPYIDATGHIYPCCGVQYARPEYLRTLGTAFSMGHWRMYESMAPFNGSFCEKCYYESYNLLLQNMTAPLQHAAFV